MEEYAACDSPVRLPYVRITKDPKRYEECLEVSKAFGRIDDSNELYDYLKKSMVAQD